ncbi:T9SS type A sorting domain-containing protein [Hymenobacter busanensis]|uniref:T9SS type A sorting domain-containing protein n=1 Tax=Hymenobacter busanensis TaxID=2607656 RepID=A0A7L4ZV56_9BACT|nr:T9SS type A sorting domain-containing protein [Hymenobacter busanensis]KAA9339540.1 T9SS type A sorting domain-containing protein [Hymenobacter busanensis]QHJ06705.1 T9SS type A sorting domain-containing protein [Hymenobacter busanensis]
MKKALLLLSFLGSSYLATAQWVSQPISFASPAYLNFTISAVDANVAWTTVVEVNNDRTATYARTVNGGAAWSAQVLPGLTATEYISDIHALNASTAWAAIAPSAPVAPGRILKTTDSGATWVQTTTTGQFASVEGYPVYVRFFDANRGVAIGEAANNRIEIYTTSNGGTSWTAVPAANIPAAQPDEFVDLLVPVVAQVGNSLWFATSENRVFRSTDAGLTWNVATTGFGSFDFPEALTFRDANNGLLMSDEGDLQRTTDGGITWAAVNPTGPHHIIGLAAVPGTRTYVSTGFSGLPGGSGSSYSTNDGQTWTAIESTVNHALVAFASPTAGWSGGVRLDSSGEIAGGTGLHKYTGTTLAAGTAKLAVVAPAYPNPSHDGQFRVPLRAGATDVLVRDAVGRVVLTQAVKPGQSDDLTLDLSGQGAGVYTLELRSSAGVAQQKLVVH